MKSKFYLKKWFVIVLLVIIPFIGWFLLWKSQEFTSKGKKIAAGLSISWMIFVLLLPGPPSASSSYDILTAEMTYMTEDIPAKDAVYEDAKSYTTELSGDYIIGTSPSELVTGEEEEFTTAESGNYVAGTDFNPGVYDIVAVSGNGNVMGTGLNEIMGVGTALASLDDMYVQTFDNHTFADGDELKVSGVSVKLVPQTDDKLVIAPNKYNLVATQGNGNVTGTGLNEIMGTGSDIDSLNGIYTEKYDNKQFKEGDELNVRGVSLTLEPVEDQILVEEATEAIAGHEQTESLISSPKGETCQIDNEDVECSDLANYDKLKAELAVSSTVTEEVVLEDDNYVCTSDKKKVKCDELVDFENLKTQLA